MTNSRPDNTLRVALARVLTRAINNGTTKGAGGDLGTMLGAKGRSKYERPRQILAGKLFPDREFSVLADFLGIDVPTLLRQIADEIAQKGARSFTVMSWPVSSTNIKSKKIVD